MHAERRRGTILKEGTTFLGVRKRRRPRERVKGIELEKGARRARPLSGGRESSTREPQSGGLLNLSGSEFYG